MKRFAVLIAALALLAFAPAANAAYPAYPTAPMGCPNGTVYTTLASFKNAVETHPASEYVCLAAGTYAGPLTINRTASGQMYAFGVGTTYGAIINGGVIHAGGSVFYNGFTFKNTTSGAGTNGDCFTLNYGIAATAVVGVHSSKITACNRMGVQMKNCALPPCSTGFPNNFNVQNSRISDVGNVDPTNGIAVVLRTNATGSNASIQDSDITDGPNDAVDVCGSGITVSRLKVHDMTAGAGIHNDVVQNSANCPPVTGLKVSRVWARNINGSDAHFLVLTGSGHNGVALDNDDVANIGTGSHGVIFGDGTNAVSNASVVSSTFYDTGTVEFNNVNTGSIKGSLFRACVDPTDGAPWLVTGGSNVTASDNTGSGAATCTATGTGAANRNPLFVNEAGLDLHIQATSPERCSTTNSPTTYDIDDQVRSSFFNMDSRGSDYVATC